MHFEWIVPVVVLVVWLLQQLLRARENEEPVRPRPGAPAQARGTSDIDRFLQEIDRMRRRSGGESAERPRPAPPPRPRPVQPAPVPRVRPVPRPVTARPSEPPPEVIVVEAVQRGTPPAVVPVPAAAPANIAPRVSRALGDEGRRLVPGARAALDLVRSPKSLASAILLQEILGPPRCRRR